MIPNCPECEEGSLIRIETNTDRYGLFKCNTCNNFICKEYKVVDIRIFRNDEYYLNKDNNLVKRKKPITTILAESEDHLLAARKGLFSLRDLWATD